MKQVMLGALLSIVCCGIASAQDMTGKIGFGLRNNTFDVRYFVTDRIGVHAGTAMGYSKTAGKAENTEYGYDAGAFYSKEITEGIKFQTGLTVQYYTGKDTGIAYKEWGYNPYVGAEFIYKGRLGIDFKVIPVQYWNVKEKGSNTYGREGGYGSFGAHLYF